MKSLTERVLEFKEGYSPKLKNAVFDAKIKLAYLQGSIKDIIPKVNKENIGKLATISFASATIAVFYSVDGFTSETTNVSEEIDVKEYIKNKFSSPRVNIYLKSLENLDLSEIEFIDTLQKLSSKEKQEFYAREVYKGGVTPNLLEKLKEELMNYSQRSFVHRLKLGGVDLSNNDDYVNIALGLMENYPNWFRNYVGTYSNGKYKADALLKLIQIVHEIEPETGMKANIFLEKHYKLISIASEKMPVFYNNACKFGYNELEKQGEGPLFDYKLDKNEYNLVKNHVLDLVKNHEAKILSLDLAEELANKNSIVLPYQLSHSTTIIDN